MDFQGWLVMVVGGIMSTALGAPLGEFLKWLLWKFIVMVRVTLSQGWRNVGAVLDATPEVQMEPNAAPNDFTDSESGGIVNGACGGEASVGTSFRESLAALDANTRR